MNSRLNKFYLFCKYWKGKIRNRLNDIFVVSISFLYFLIKCPFWFSCFNFHSILYRFNDLLYRLNDNKSFNRDICCFDFRSNLLVSISFLINIGKEMSLPGFRTQAISFCTVTISVWYHSCNLFPARVGKKPSETDSIMSKISSKTSREKKDTHKKTPSQT